jgi:hypothetical protein
MQKTIPLLIEVVTSCQSPLKGCILDRGDPVGSSSRQSLPSLHAGRARVGAVLILYTPFPSWDLGSYPLTLR